MSDEPETPTQEPWQPPDWLRDKPTEWKSTTWDDWVARDAPLASEEPAAAPEPETPSVPVVEAAPPPPPSSPPPAPSPSNVVEIAEPVEAPAEPEPDRRQETWEEIAPRLYALLGDEQSARLGLQSVSGGVGEAPTARELDEALGRARPAEAPVGTLFVTESTVWLVGLVAGVAALMVSALSEVVPGWIVSPLAAYFAATSWAWVVWRQRLDQWGARYRRAASKVEDPVVESLARAQAWKTLRPRLRDWLSVDLAECLTPRDRNGEVIDGPTVDELEEALRSQMRGGDLRALLFDHTGRLGSLLVDYGAAVALERERLARLHAALRSELEAKGSP